MKAPGLILASAVLCLLQWSSVAAAQSAKEYQIPSDKMKCLRTHQSKYLELSRVLVRFTPAYCPAVTREEVALMAAASLNSGSTSTKSVQRIMLSKKNFRCLIRKIDQHIAGLPAAADDGGKSQESTSIVIKLDCEN